MGTTTIAKVNYPEKDNSVSSSSIYTPSLIKLINNDADKTEKDQAREETATSIKIMADIHVSNPQMIRDTLEAQRIEVESTRKAKEKELLRLQVESYHMYQVEKMCLDILSDII